MMRRLSSWSSTIRIRLLMSLHSRFCTDRQSESERGALPGARYHPQTSAVQFDDLLGNREAQARASLPPGAGIVGLLEAK